MSDLLLLLGQVSQNFQQSFPCMGHHAEKDSLVKHLISFFFFLFLFFTFEIFFKFKIFNSYMRSQT